MSRSNFNSTKTSRFSKTKFHKKNVVKRNNEAVTVGEVRIIGGRFKRHSIPFIEAEGLRPTPDRLREILFNWIQFDLHDMTVLDLCAGSGVLGFETISRGARYVTFIELQAKQAQLIKNTASKLRLETESFDVFTGDALRIIPQLVDLPKTQLPYDLVFIDPPYDLNLWIPILSQLLAYKLINANTLLYIEDKRVLEDTLETFTLKYSVIKDKKVGQIFASLIQLHL